LESTEPSEAIVIEIIPLLVHSVVDHSHVSVREGGEGERNEEEANTYFQEILFSSRISPMVVQLNPGRGSELSRIAPSPTDKPLLPEKRWRRLGFV
jgi:hypothetical protein